MATTKSNTKEKSASTKSTATKAEPKSNAKSTKSTESKSASKSTGAGKSAADTTAAARAAGKKATSGTKSAESKSGSKSAESKSSASKSSDTKSSGTKSATSKSTGTKKSSGSSKSSTSTRDHETIRAWAEKRGGIPSMVKGTGKKKSDTGILRIDFPGYSGEDSLQEISWDEFFEKFDESKLEFLYQETTSKGEESRFNKFVSSN